ncbi:AraC family transcriptional regulator [Mesorhizobium sp. BR1-1-16]|uniref:AraC family transcriptional regulator n=1 Tax=Mesorhizobium sp. BR1-1-16 TaxID=2876653 RepID=UPI001CCA1F9A|nr:AraC family transcriptional regulator [Mesorhizobium sp. BR1-1-16]MBZ9937002.1 AraC family transcriptional regulator [Mesorhizobium sp. BR1-1-16]
MTQTLLAAADRYAEANADSYGVATTPVPGLAVVRETMPTALQYAINRPLVALVLQGRKHVAMGASTFDLHPGESLLITADVPTVSQITEANLARPYISIFFEIDAAVVAELVTET